MRRMVDNEAQVRMRSQLEEEGGGNERSWLAETEKVNVVQELPPHSLVSVSKLWLNFVTSSESLKTLCSMGAGASSAPPSVSAPRWMFPADPAAVWWSFLLRLRSPPNTFSAPFLNFSSMSNSSLRRRSFPVYPSLTLIINLESSVKLMFTFLDCEEKQGEDAKWRWQVHTSSVAGWVSTSARKGQIKTCWVHLQTVCMCLRVCEVYRVWECHSCRSFKFSPLFSCAVYLLCFIWGRNGEEKESFLLVLTIFLL